MPSLLGWPLIVYYLMLPRPNLSGWEVADVWLVLTGPLLPLPFHTFAFKIQSETWGSFLTKSLASPCTSTSSLAPAIISSASCELCLALCPAALQLGMYWVQFFTGYRVQGIKTVFYRVRVPSTGYLTN